MSSWLHGNLTPIVHFLFVFPPPINDTFRLTNLFDGFTGDYGAINQSPFAYLDAEVRNDALALDALSKQIPTGTLSQCSATCSATFVDPAEEDFCQDACDCVSACSTNTTCAGDCSAVYNGYAVFDWLHGIALEYQACIYGVSIGTDSSACDTFTEAWNDNTWNTNGALDNCASVECFENDDDDDDGPYGRVTNYCVEVEDEDDDDDRRMLRQRNLQGVCPVDSFCGENFEQLSDCV